MSTSQTNPERYLTASEVQAQLPFDASDFPVQDQSQYDAALESALDAASSMVEEWTDTVFVPTTETATFSRSKGTPDRELPMPDRPVRDVSSVSVGQHDLAADDYRVGETYLYLLPSAPVSAWPTEQLACVITYTHGYDEVPAPVEQAIIRLVRNAMDQIETDGLESDRTASESYTYRPPADIKRECAAMVRPYTAPSYFGGAQTI